MTTNSEQGNENAKINTF